MQRVVVVAEMPGLGHALAHGAQAAVDAVLRAEEGWRREIPGLRRLGGRWALVTTDTAEALEAAFCIARARTAAVVLDVGEVIEQDGEPWGHPVWQAGQLTTRHGRAGQVLATASVMARLSPPPEGVGCFAAAAELSRAAGVALWCLVDAR